MKLMIRERGVESNLLQQHYGKTSRELSERLAGLGEKLGSMSAEVLLRDAAWSLSESAAVPL